jgi:tight adherence protein C
VDPFADPGDVMAAACVAGAIVALAAGVRAAARTPILGLAPAVPEPDSRTVRTTPGARRDRAKELHAEIPQLLDLLAAGSTAGLSAELSFRQAIDCLRGPLAEDLAAVIRRVDLGAPWRDEMGAYVEATGDPDLVRTMTVLARSETLGVSLRDATRELAATVRDAHRSAALERARSAPVKMLFPLVFLILPAFLLLTVVPVLITTVRTI